MLLSSDRSMCGGKMVVRTTANLTKTGGRLPRLVCHPTVVVRVAVSYGEVDDGASVWHEADASGVRTTQYRKVRTQLARSVSLRATLKGHRQRWGRRKVDTNSFRCYQMRGLEEAAHEESTRRPMGSRWWCRSTIDARAL